MKSLRTKINESASIEALYKATDKNEIDRIRRDFKKSMWKDADIDAALKKYADKQPVKSTSSKPASHYDNRHTPKSWNKRSYDKWIKDVSGNDGATHAFDMAQNADKTLIAYVQGELRKSGQSDITPLERIQWDIEAHA